MSEDCGGTGHDMKDLLGGAECVLCALSPLQLSQEWPPLALTFILGADRLAVI